MSIALSGPTGFVGAAIQRQANSQQMELVPLVRSHSANSPNSARVIGNLDGSTIDPSLLAGCTSVIHTAARAHRMGEHGDAALAAYRQTNVAGTQALITAMVAAGVRRLVYVSSIKAVGERSTRAPLHPNDVRQPEDPYGISKAEAEDAIRAAASSGSIEAVIVRPVLVHGPGAKGNLNRLMAAIARSRMLPLGAVHNRRSMVGVENLADALLTAATREWDVLGGETMIDAPGRAGQEDGRASGPRSVALPRVYHIADDGVISTRRLVEVLAEGMGVTPRLISVPRWLAVGGATVLGKGAMARRLFDDLEVDDSDFRRDYGWKPKLGLEDGLRAMAADYARRMREG